MEYLKNVLKKTGWMSLVESVIFAIIGLVLIQNPEGTVKFMSYLLGAIFILIGIYKIVVHVMEKQNGGLYNYSFVYGIMAVVIGIITIAFSSTIGNLFRIIIGVWIIYSALLRATSALKLREYKSNVWIYAIVLAVVMLVCGIYIVANSGAIVSTIGVFVLIYSIIDIIENIIFLKNVNDMK